VAARRMTREQAQVRQSVVAPQWSELAGAAASCARWIRAAAGGSSATVRVVVPDDTDRLHVIACEGPNDAPGRLRSQRRRSVFLTRRPAHLRVRGSSDMSLGLFPLDNGAEAAGVVEVLAPTAMIEARQEVLVALAEQSSIVLANARRQREAERELAGKNALLELAAELLWVRTATEAVRQAVRACHQHVGRPTAGLIPDRDGWGWFLAASDGLGADRRDSLRASLRAGDASRRLRMPSLRTRFREVGGYRDVLSVRAGAAVFLIGDAPTGADDFVQGLVSLVKGVLPRLGLDGVRPSVIRSNELGIAWTAHELKGPLLGASAALDRAAQATRSEGKELMRRTRRELQQLSDLIDPLLRWSTGNGLPSRRRVDLVEVTREAVASATLGAQTNRVSIEAQSELLVLGDPEQLRSAIANVVRNALTYSAAGTEVRVRVEDPNGSARVVVRDRGPGIPPQDRETVFDPFSRGRSNGSAHHGAGLGLFIARRVLEAHGGTVSLRPSKSGATFVLQLPAERWQLSAS
jgi:signal transduction histidine kinase